MNDSTKNNEFVRLNHGREFNGFIFLHSQFKPNTKFFEFRILDLRMKKINFGMIFETFPTNFMIFLQLLNIDRGKSTRLAFLGCIFIY